MPLIPFSDADLAMNDEGFFSAAQQMSLKRKTDLYIALSVISALMGFVSALIFFYVGQNSNNLIFATGLCITIFGICFCGIFWSLALANQIKRGYGVKKVEGRAELYIVYTGKNRDIPNYNLRIQNVNFHLN